MHRQLLFLLSLVGGLATFGTTASALLGKEPTPDELAFFESKIRPVLAQSCYKCHAETSSKVRGGLLLDTREGIRLGGDTGPAIVPGDLEKSLLIEAIRYTNPDTEMPPQKSGGKLPDAVIADFERWVKMGAPDPRERKSAAVAPTKKWDSEGAKKWWAFQPLRPPPVPATKETAWARSDIDRFVLSGLEAKWIKPVEDADKVTLLRRVSFDLIGLPPAPELSRWFLANDSPQAFAQLVDALLAKPQFGERWGRHWLDVARYAESTGKELNEPGERVPRGFPTFLSRGAPVAIPATTSGRKELADWIASPTNPLTARVMANRIWHWLFGEGLVSTVDNFGTMGAAPSNQALLDHLACRLIENRWSIKTTLREIVLSRTYQLASTHDEANFATDPGNALLWRHAKRRLDAECIRDAMLAASGQLDLAPPLGSVVARAGDGVIGSTGGFVRINEDSLLNATATYRSVYLPIARDLLPDALTVFDYTDANTVRGAREQTNVPAQTLYLLNNDFVLAQAGKFAERLAAHSPAGGAPRVALAYALAFGRRATPTEIEKADAFLKRQGALGISAAEAWRNLCLALFASAEFRFLD